MSPLESPNKTPFAGDSTNKGLRVIHINTIDTLFKHNLERTMLASQNSVFLGVRIFKNGVPTVIVGMSIAKMWSNDKNSNLWRRHKKTPFRVRKGVLEKLKTMALVNSRPLLKPKMSKGYFSIIFYRPFYL